MSESLKTALENVLADTYALYLKTQNYHWNICSPHFRDLHLLLEDHYGNLATATDEIAEQIRIVGYKVPATFDFLKSKTSLKDPNHELAAQAMIADLLQDHQTTVKTIKTAITAAQGADDPGTEDLLIERIRFHTKVIWFLRSICEG